VRRHFHRLHGDEISRELVKTRGSDNLPLVWNAEEASAFLKLREPFAYVNNEGELGVVTARDYAGRTAEEDARAAKLAKQMIAPATSHRRFR